VSPDPAAAATADAVRVVQLGQRVQELEQRLEQLAARPAAAACGEAAVSGASGAPDLPSAPLTPEQAASLYQQGSRALVEGRFRFAAEAFQRVLRADREHGRAYRGLGLAVAELGDTGRAIAALQKYMKLSSGADDRIHILERLRDLERTQRQ
jgi:tetratricopeptide (TPR) repeat protein